jgi:TatA/E family protein of Tat protein translocase
MNGTILGVGPLEVLFILILILLVFGPERLPEFTRGLGVALRRLRETYVAFTQEFKGELQPIAQDIDEVTREIRREVQAIREAADIRAILQPYADDISRNVSLNAPPGAPALPAANSSNGAAPSGGAQNSAAQNSAAQNGAASNLPTLLPPSATPTNAVTTGGAAPTPRLTIVPNGARVVAPPPPNPEGHPPVELSEDNPWASIGTTIRTDRLDDDNPWRS